VRPSRLLNRASATRALKDFLSALDAGSDLPNFRNRVTELSATRNRVHFGPFNLFQFNAYEWFLPKPTVGIAEYLAIYESYVSQDLGWTEGHWESAARIYRGNSAAKKLLRAKHVEEWMSPAMILAAAAQHLGGEVEDSGPAMAQVRLGNGLLGVAPTGCWSNKLGRMIPVAVPAFDLDCPATSFGGVVVVNPVLEAIMEASHNFLGWKYRMVGTTLGLALQEEIIDPAWLRTMVFNGDPPKAPKRDLSGAESAAAECLAILEAVDGDVVINLWDAAVPNLMSSRDFRVTFGDPKQSNPTRKIKRTTIIKWRGVIESALEEIMKN
jgi:hypothetical protein